MELSPRTYRRICAVALWALAGIVVTGAAVRLTGSGLGCTDWPACEQNQFQASLEVQPMIEFVNRLITGIVSIAVIVAVAGSLLRRPRRADLTRWSLGLVAGVVGQIIIGAFVTLSELAYSVVALHFLVSMVLVWAAVQLLERAGRPDDAPAPGPAPPIARALVGLGALVLVVGSVVTSAGPHAGDEDVRRLPVDLGQVARLHSVTVWVFLAVLVAGLVRRRGLSPLADRRGTDLLVAAVAQGAVGYSQYFFGVPALLVGFHVAGATLVWVLTIRYAFALSPATVPGTAPEPART